MTIQTHTQFENGSVVAVPLNRLKASPKNARKTPHRRADIETLAASIAAKGLLQPLVVAPERDAESALTGFYLVTIGEGRRQAMLLRAKRKEIKKSEPVRCIVDVANDAHEISLDENVTRFAMHPADQFEAFQQLAEERGYGAEEIAARFGVTPAVVRQRLKLAAVSPKLMTIYRQDGMTLDQLMAFTITDDHDRQEAVWENLSWNKEPHLIRRMLTQDRVRASDKRARFVGLEAYEAAGGIVERDLFSEDHGGYWTDPALLDRLALAKLSEVSDSLLADGWKWVEPSLEHPAAFGMGRIYPTLRQLPPEDQARYDTLSQDHETLAVEHEADDELADAIDAKLTAMAMEMQTLDAQRRAYADEDKARSGVFVLIGDDGEARVEAGFIRKEDEAPPSPDGSDDRSEDAGHAPTKARDPQTSTLLSDKLVADLTAHRTAALQALIGENEEVALAAIVHALALQVFPAISGGSCVEVTIRQVHLPSYTSGIAETKAGKQIEARHAAWAEALPKSSDLLWSAILAMDHGRKLALLAHCVGMTVNGLRNFDGRGAGLAHAEQLATAVRLDMADYWAPTVDSYLGRVTKRHILDAVHEGASPEDALRLEGLKKEPMAEAAETLLAGKRWLPTILRTDEATAESDVLQAAE